MSWSECYSTTGSLRRCGGQPRIWAAGTPTSGWRSRCSPLRTEQAGASVTGAAEVIGAVIAGRGHRRDGRIVMGLVTAVEPVPLGELGRVHFAGIGGAGMSGIARIMLARGVAVSGCDAAASSQLDELAALGAQGCVGHSARHLGSAGTLVVSGAVRAGNPQPLP